jgi:fructosamine-3-kinase
VSVPPALAAAVARAAGVEVTGGARAAGGSINEAWALELAGGGRAFVKTRADAAPGEYATEAAGLRWLAQADAVELPAVLAVGDGA